MVHQFLFFPEIPGPTRKVPPKFSGSETNEIVKHNTNKQPNHQTSYREPVSKVTYHSDDDDHFGSAEDSDDSDSNIGNFGDGDDPLYGNNNNVLKPTRSGLDYSKKLSNNNNNNINSIVLKTPTKKPAHNFGGNDASFISSGRQQQFNIINIILLLSLIVLLRYSHLIT